jgi:hypothetical protein
MRGHLRFSLLVTTLVLSLAAWSRAGANPKVDAQTAARLLVAQLGSERFAERERASQALDSLGPAALKVLREACRSSDCEVRRRAEDVVRRITQRVEAARLLEARRVHLVFKDMRVSEAVEVFSRTTGFRIQLEGDTQKLAERKITLDTGPTTFWRAFDQFCQQAGLTERPASGNGSPNGDYFIEGRGRGRRLIIDDGRSYQPPNQEGKLTLIDGQAQVLPTAYDGGSIRIRAPRPPEEKGEKELQGKGGSKRGRSRGEVQNPSSLFLRSDCDVLLALEVATEPRILYQGFVNVRIDRAVDDKGQELRQTIAFGDGQVRSSEYLWNEVLWDMRTGQPVNPLGVGGQVPLRLKTASQPSTMLKELRGAITIQVRTPPEPLLTVDNILAAVNQTVTGADGGSLKVLEVKREANGQVRLRVQVEPPAQDQLNDLAGQVQVLRIRQGLLGMAEEVSQGTAKHLTLLDRQGKEVPQDTKESGLEGSDENGHQVYRLLYRPHKDQPESARLVYSDRRSMIVEVPFVLKDVPLPK